jgi:hypothetical protein
MKPDQLHGKLFPSSLPWVALGTNVLINVLKECWVGCWHSFYSCQGSVALTDLLTKEQWVECPNFAPVSLCEGALLGSASIVFKTCVGCTIDLKSVVFFMDCLFKGTDQFDNKPCFAELPFQKKLNDAAQRSLQAPHAGHWTGNPFVWLHELATSQGKMNREGMFHVHFWCRWMQPKPEKKSRLAWTGSWEGYLVFHSL